MAINTVKDYLGQAQRLVGHLKRSNFVYVTPPLNAQGLFESLTIACTALIKRKTNDGNAFCGPWCHLDGP
jgi:hypothetical protein